MKYKMLALDIDGTLLTDDKRLTDKVKKAVKNALDAGTIVTICTGRPIQGVEWLCRELSMENMPIITYNGAVVVAGGDRKILYEKGVGPDEAREILSYVDYTKTTVVLWSQNQLYVNESNERTEKYKTLSGVEPVVFEDAEDIICQGITKILLIGGEEDVQEVKRRVEVGGLADKVNFYTSNPKFLEFINKETSKGEAMGIIGDIYGITREEMIAIGDGCNDVPMIEYAGLGVAMANAGAEVRAKADYVTLSNEEDGVAAVIEKFILN